MQQITAFSAKTCQNVLQNLSGPFPARARALFFSSCAIRTHILTHFVLSLRSITSFVPMFRPTSSTHFVRLLVRSLLTHFVRSTCVSHSLRSFERNSLTSFVHSIAHSLRSFESLVLHSLRSFITLSLTSFVRRNSHFVRILTHFLTSFESSFSHSVRSLRSLTSFVAHFLTHFVRSKVRTDFLYLDFSKRKSKIENQSERVKRTNDSVERSEWTKWTNVVREFERSENDSVERTKWVREFERSENDSVEFFFRLEKKNSYRTNEVSERAERTKWVKR